MTRSVKLVGPADWQARWIWAEQCLATPNSYVYFRRNLEIDRVANATAYVTASSAYRLYVNRDHASPAASRTISTT